KQRKAEAPEHPAWRSYGEILIHTLSTPAYYTLESFKQRYYTKEHRIFEMYICGYHHIKFTWQEETVWPYPMTSTGFFTPWRSPAASPTAPRRCTATSPT